jgi:hypothetical protein
VPSNHSSADGFYLRAGRSQALAPQYTFAWLPVVTISDGILIDGNVAVPAIYPGPLWIGPSARTISAGATDAIVAEARRLGLLGGKSDFTGAPMPGSVIAHIAMTVDGRAYELVGDPAAMATCNCTPEPGTAAAFGAFWDKVTGLSGWLPGELGASVPFEPDRLAVLSMPPAEAANGISAKQVPWPLATPLSSFGTPFGGEFRCAVATGADLAKLVPVVKSANQLTQFVDGTGVARSLQVRPLVPGEPSPCAAQ